MLLNCQIDRAGVPSSSSLSRRQYLFSRQAPKKRERLKLKAQIKIDGRVRFRRNFNLWELSCLKNAQ